ncbi:MAG: O-antigen ligase family protein [Clostridia bacterium]|nr:O-antigen ligase family protein [Clostridia bacterium]
MEEIYTKNSKIYAGLYIFFIFCAAMGDYKPLNVALGGLPKVLSAGGFGVAFIYVMWSGNFKNVKAIFHFFVMYLSIIAGIILWSVVLWILDFQTIGYIMKGTSKMSFQFLDLLVVIGAGYMFEEKAAKYTFIGLAAGNLLIIALGAVTTGVGGAIHDLIANITSFGASDVIENSKFIRAIEIHDITFVMGVYVIYFIFFCFGEKRRFIYAGLALFLFMAGLKRIAFMGMIMAMVFAAFTSWLNPKAKRRWLTIVSILIVVFCYYYLSIIHSGAFTAFLEEHEIELMGREKIYDFISNFYTISPSYRGRGYEFCVELLRSMHGTKDQVVDITAVHNDILKMYVELGFWGFLLWITGYYVYQTHWFITRCGEKTAACFMTINLYMLISYLTDNTMFYYWSSMVLRIVPMAFFFDPVKEMPLKIKDEDEMTKFERKLYAKREKAAAQQREGWLNEYSDFGDE